MTSCPPTPHQRSHRFRSVVEVELAHLVLVAHRDQPGQRVTRVLPDLRVTLANVDLPDQKALEGFRVHLDLLAVELEGPRYLAPKGLGVLLALLDQRGSRAFRVLLVPLERTDNLAPRARMEQLVPLDHKDLPDPKDLPDLQESVVPPVRMQLLLSSIGISPRMRQPRPTARRLTSKTHSDRRTHSRTELGTTLR